MQHISIQQKPLANDTNKNHMYINTKFEEVNLISSMSRVWCDFSSTDTHS